MRKYVVIALGYVVFIPSCSIAVSNLRAASTIRFYLGALFVLGLIAYGIALTTHLFNQIRTDLELRNIASKL